MSRCKGCNAEIRWIKTIQGKNHPVDAKPVKIWINGTDLGIPGGGWSLESGWVSHFATCPKAHQFRRPGE